MKKILAFFCLGVALFALIGQGLVMMDSTPWQLSISRIENGVEIPVKLPEPKIVFIGHGVSAEEGSIVLVAGDGIELMGPGGFYRESKEATVLRHIVWWAMFAACLIAGLYLLRAVRRERKEALAALAGAEPKIRLTRASSATRSQDGASAGPGAGS